MFCVKFLLIFLVFGIIIMMGVCFVRCWCDIGWMWKERLWSGCLSLLSILILWLFVLDVNCFVLFCLKVLGCRFLLGFEVLVVRIFWFCFFEGDCVGILFGFLFVFCFGVLFLCLFCVLI